MVTDRQSMDVSNSSVPKSLDSLVMAQEALPRNVSDPPPPHAPSPVSSSASSKQHAPSFVFAVGRVEPRFPSVAVEKEFAQAVGRAETAGLTDRQALRELLAIRENRYLARQLAWVHMIEGLETYLLVPRDPSDVELLIAALRPTHRLTDMDVVIGTLGPLAPPEFANGLVVPIVIFDQVYSFDVDGLISAIPRPESMSPESFEPAAEDLFIRVIQIADNAGATDEHRALNYVAIRYPAIYEEAARALAANSALSSIRAKLSRLSGTRRIIDVILSFRSRQTDVEESFFVRVDVQEEWPFLVTRLSPYYERT